MALGKHAEVVKNIRTALEYEQQLQLSYSEKGVHVVDIYSGEWGPCKAINETFRQLFTERMGEGIPLKFISAETRSILESLQNPEEQNFKRPKNTDAIKDTLPEAWQGMLETRKGRSKPYFAIYKEGKLVSTIEGVETPLIKSKVKELCRVLIPARDVITDPDLLAVWEEHFPPEESEITYLQFLHGMATIADATEPLTELENETLMHALGINVDMHMKMVTAAHLQKFVNPPVPEHSPTSPEHEELPPHRTLVEAFNALLPEYAPRALEEREIRLHEESEKRKVAEEEAALKSRRESAAAAERALEAERERVERISAVQSEMEQLVQDCGGAVAAPTDMDTEEMSVAQDFMRVATSELSPLTPQRECELVLHPAEEEGPAQDAAKAAAELICSAPTFIDFMATHEIMATRLAAVRAFASEQFKNSVLFDDGKLAVLSCLCDSADVKSLFGGDAALDFQAASMRGELLSYAPALAAFTLITAQTDRTEGAAEEDSEEELLVSAFGRAQIPQWEQLEVEKEVVLPAMTPLYSRQSEESCVVVRGLPRVVSTKDCSLHTAGESHVVFCPWFTVCRVEEKTDERVVLVYERTFNPESMSSALQTAEEREVNSQKLLHNLSCIRKSVEELHVLKGDALGGHATQGPTHEEIKQELEAVRNVSPPSAMPEMPLDIPSELAAKLYAEEGDNDQLPQPSKEEQDMSVELREAAPEPPVDLSTEIPAPNSKEVSEEHSVANEEATVGAENAAPENIKDTVEVAEENAAAEVPTVAAEEAALNMEAGELSDKQREEL